MAVILYPQGMLGVVRPCQSLGTLKWPKSLNWTSTRHFTFMFHLTVSAMAALPIKENSQPSSVHTILPIRFLCRFFFSSFHTYNRVLVTCLSFASFFAPHCCCCPLHQFRTMSVNFLIVFNLGYHDMSRAQIEEARSNSILIFFQSTDNSPKSTNR